MMIKLHYDNITQKCNFIKAEKALFIGILLFFRQYFLKFGDLKNGNDLQLFII